MANPGKMSTDEPLWLAGLHFLPMSGADHGPCEQRPIDEQFDHKCRVCALSP